jgi:hypothetical protein
MQVLVAMDQIKLMEVEEEAKDDKDLSTLRTFYKKFSYLSPMEHWSSSHVLYGESRLVNSSHIVNPLLT